MTFIMAKLCFLIPVVLLCGPELGDFIMVIDKETGRGCAWGITSKTISRQLIADGIVGQSLFSKPRSDGADLILAREDSHGEIYVAVQRTQTLEPELLWAPSFIDAGTWTRAISQFQSYVSLERNVENHLIPRMDEYLKCISDTELTAMTRDFLIGHGIIRMPIRQISGDTYYFNEEEIYFSIVDVVAVLTEAPNHQAARNYWKVTKKRLVDEGFELVTSCNQLKMTAADRKKRLTDVADTEQLLRIIQSIPSHKAEPFKRWLAEVGREHIEETIDPELTIDRALETYLKKGYSREWINQRLQAIQVRKELTDEWDARGVQKGVEYAILTDEMSRAWSGMTTRQYKTLMGLTKENSPR